MKRWRSPKLVALSLAALLGYAATMAPFGPRRAVLAEPKAAEGRIEHTNGYIFSADETADVGQDDATPVTEDYKERDNKFTGKIEKVTIDLVKP